jgi:hypothetical protein
MLVAGCEHSMLVAVCEAEIPNVLHAAPDALAAYAQAADVPPRYNKNNKEMMS